MPTRAVAGIVLAAGRSTRMGRNKMLLDVGGESVVRGAARRATAGGLAPVVVVLGADADRTGVELEGLPCQIVRNAHYASGIASSVHTGVASLPAMASAAMVLLADMPLVSTDMIRAMIERYERTHALLVISDYDGVNAPPVLYDRRLFAELLATNDQQCGRRVVERHRHEVQVLGWPAAALGDLDRPEDYARLVESRGGG
jgi:molybdenum cofactor cytidylyltransferase